MVFSLDILSVLNTLREQFDCLSNIMDNQFRTVGTCGLVDRVLDASSKGLQFDPPLLVMTCVQLACKLLCRLPLPT